MHFVEIYAKISNEDENDLNYTKFGFCLTLLLKGVKQTMELIVFRRKSKNGEGTYLVLEAVADWGRVPITYESGNIIQLLPFGINHREITEKGVAIGRIND